MNHKPLTTTLIFYIGYSRLFWVYLKKHNEKIDNPSINKIEIKPNKIVNKIENRIIFEIKTEYYLELLTLEKMKLLRSAENKICNDRNG